MSVDSDRGRWPDFFIVGAPKAGTTSLYRYLNRIPGIFLSPTKEPHFFIPETAIVSKITRIETEDKYLQLFNAALLGDLCGEASTAYLRAPEAPKLIAASSPQAKIIIILREPAARAFSHYLMRWAAGGISVSFEDGLDKFHWNEEGYSTFLQGVIKPGFYTEQVKRYLEVFGADNVKIFMFDDFARDPESIVAETLEFLGVDAAPVLENYQSHNNYQAIRGRWAHALLSKKYLFRWLKPLVPPQLKWKLIRLFLQKEADKPTLTPADRATLTQIYQADVLQLRLLLQKPGLWSEHYPLG